MGHAHLHGCVLCAHTWVATWSAPPRRRKPQAEQRDVAVCERTRQACACKNRLHGTDRHHALLSRPHGGLRAAVKDAAGNAMAPAITPIQVDQLQTQARITAPALNLSLSAKHLLSCLAWPARSLMQHRLQARKQAAPALALQARCSSAKEHRHVQVWQRPGQMKPHARSSPAHGMPSQQVRTQTLRRCMAGSGDAAVGFQRGRRRERRRPVAGRPGRRDRGGRRCGALPARGRRPGPAQAAGAWRGERGALCIWLACGKLTS